MKRKLTVMTCKGQITVPAEIRGALGLRISDKIEVALDETDGVLDARLTPVRSVVDMTFGALASSRQPMGTDEERSEFMEHALERDERIKRELAG